MSEWLHSLPLAWMALVVFGATYLATWGIYRAVTTLAVGERARAFKGVSPGMLPPLGIIFGLLVAFLAAQAWSDFDKAHTAVHHEASALRAVVLLIASFPGEPEVRTRALIRHHVQEAAAQEWPAIASGRARLTITPRPLAEALELTLGLVPRSDGQAAAQREIVASLQSALDARRQRILISGSAINWIKWTGLLLQAACTLVAIAMVHCDNRATAALALALFATAVALCTLLIAAHDRPFTGHISVGPDVLLQVMPAE